MRRHSTTIGRPEKVSCRGCGRQIENTRHPDLERDQEDWCSLACLEGRRDERPGVSDTMVLADGGELDAE